MDLPYRFGKYVLTRKIAQGGMAEIYKAKYIGEGGFAKDVAVKRILPVWSDSSDFIKMLCDEANALVHLQHQNIVQVYELGKDGNAYYIAMEFVEGADLRRLFKKGRFPVKFSCFVVSEILKGLEFAHNKSDKNGRPLGIIHRDISPQNILVSLGGEVKVADFGIAKGSHRSYETVTTQVKGKYAYMSPEQAQGLVIDPRCDLYSAGVIFYELITGKRLYDAPNDLLTIEEVKRSVLPDGWEDDVPMGVRPIIRKALQKEISERYQTAADFLNDISRFIAANDMLTNGIEFSAFLKGHLKDEYDKIVSDDSFEITEPEGGVKQPTRILSVISKVKANDIRRFNRKIFYPVIGSVMLFSIGLLGGSFIKSGNDTAKATADVAQPIAVPVALASIPPPPPVEIQQKAAEVVTPEPQKNISSSQLFVQAKPWGYVYIPGEVSRKETPLRGVKLKEGSYVVKVNYEPEDKWLQQKITLAANTKMACIADFTDSNKMTCKTIP